MKTIAQQLNVKEFPFTIKDSKGNGIYFESSDGYWNKNEFDSNGNLIYFENSDGYIEDNRNIPEYTMEELVEKIETMKKVEVIVIRKPHLIEELEGFTQQKEIYDLDETTTLTYVDGDKLGGLIIDPEESYGQRFWFKAKAKVYDIFSKSLKEYKAYVRATDVKKASFALNKELSLSYYEFEITTLEKTEAVLLY